MPISSLDPSTALIVVDLQAGVVQNALAHPVGDIIDRSVALLGAFRDRGLPVVLVNVAGTPSGRTDAGGGGRSLPAAFCDLIPELGMQPSDMLVTKHARSAFAGTGLADRLRSLSVTQVVITGIATSSGVESTARDAHEQGFHVTVPVDAITDTGMTRHTHSVDQIFPRIAETGTTQDVLDLLANRA